jgi:Bacterial low temperature requirement A protein (LtrA)
MLGRIRFRRWWQPPRPASNRPEERRVTFLELFYDLVYVVIIAELSHTLAGNMNLAGIGTFFFLFIIILIGERNQLMGFTPNRSVFLPTSPSMR